MKIIFLGTPEFAVPSLQKLISWSDVQVVAVVTQPDRPYGRGQNIHSSPVKLIAQQYSIPVLQPERLSKSPDVVQAMRQLSPDLLISVAFGQILKPEVLTLAPFGVINVHGSLLPKYRGAAPINWAIINNESVTGVTTMFSDAGIDTGKMLLTETINITPDMNAEGLASCMAVVGGDLLIKTLRQLQAGTLIPVDQDNSQATMAPRLDKDIGNIDWSKTPDQIHALVRGLVPWPGTYSYLSGNLVKIIKTRLCLQRLVEKKPPGTIINSKKAKFIDDPASSTTKLSGQEILIACGTGQEVIELLEVKPANKGQMTAGAWINGIKLSESTAFSSN